MALLRGHGGAPFDPGAGWTWLSATPGPGHARLAFAHTTGVRLRVRLESPRRNKSAFAHSRSFAISHEGALDPNPAANAAALLRRVVAAVQAADPGGKSLGLTPTDRHDRPQTQGHDVGHPLAGGAGREPTPLDQVQLAVAGTLLLLAALALLSLAVPLVFRDLNALPERGWLLGVLIASAAARLVTEPRLVTMFMAYRQTDTALAFDVVPRYGAGAHVLHAALLRLGPVDHLTVIAGNTACALLTLPVLSAIAARLQPLPWAATAAAVATGLSPLLIRDARTESNLLPVQLALWSGGYLWLRWLKSGRRHEVIGAATLLLLAAVSRPEMVAVVPLAMLALAVASGGQARLRTSGALLATLTAVGVVVVAPHVVHIIGQSGQLHDGLRPLRWIATDMFARNVAMRPLWFPVGVTLVATSALWLPAHAPRRAARALWALALLWGATYLVDLPEISVPRLYAGSVTTLSLAAAIGAAALLSRWPQRRRRAAACLCVLFAASAAVTVHTVFRPTNQDLEERVLRKLTSHLPAHPACVLRLGDADPPAPGDVHRYHPDYPWRAAGHRVFDLRDLQSAQDSCREVYAVQGLRCYARSRHSAQKTGLVAACRRLQRDANLVPLWGERVPVGEEDPFYWWRGQQTFDVGVFRVGIGAL